MNSKKLALHRCYAFYAFQGSFIFKLSFESFNTLHDIFLFFDEEIEDDGKGSDLLEATEEVHAGVKTGTRNLILSPVLFR